jgi:hypothetical protein
MLAEGSLRPATGHIAGRLASLAATKNGTRAMCMDALYSIVKVPILVGMPLVAPADVCENTHMENTK